MGCNKIINTDYYKLTKINPKSLRNYMVTDAGEKAMDRLYNDLKDLVSSYPNFEEWFDTIVRPEVDCAEGKREIIIALSEVEENPKAILTGIAILKNTDKQKKICTFRIHENYRNQGIGSELFEQCFEYLGTRKPVISISEDKINMFEKHIEKYGFELVEILDAKYVKGKKEYVYNGML